MENNELLNEGKYQETKKKIKKLALIILIGGLLIGTTLIICGNVMANKAEENVENIDLSTNTNSRSEEEIQADIDATEKQIAEVEENIDKLEAQLSDDSITNSTDLYNQINSENRKLTSLKSDLRKYETELSEAEFNNNETKKQVEDTAENILNKATKSIASAKYNRVIGLGVALIIISVLASGGLYIFAIKREIKAFSVQQKMPLYQEEIEKMKQK